MLSLSLLPPPISELSELRLTFRWQRPGVAIWKVLERHDHLALGQRRHANLAWGQRRHANLAYGQRRHAHLAWGQRRHAQFAWGQRRHAHLAWGQWRHSRLLQRHASAFGRLVWNAPIIGRRFHTLHTLF